MTVLTLGGLEAHNPLAFFAALGLLRVLDHDAVVRKRPRPRLGFVDQGTWVAQLTTEPYFRSVAPSRDLGSLQKTCKSLAAAFERAFTCPVLASYAFRVEVEGEALAELVKEVASWGQELRPLAPKDMKELLEALVAVQQEEASTAGG